MTIRIFQAADMQLPARRLRLCHPIDELIIDAVFTDDVNGHYAEIEFDLLLQPTEDVKAQ
ncbi:hypothetical protein [Pseudomonas veronii]|uniref:hypothetical protein n=1 Tax=Pseudomonas veronii TaxID=76761 RepID=UPI0021ADBAA7|nr:hypothetical protein [Pseudomonas veronii]